MKESVGDLMVFRATRRIEAGEEIVHRYDQSSDYDARTATLMNTWGFTCTCGLCTVESKESLDVRKKRKELESEAIAFMERHAAVGAKRLSIVKARRLARSIGNTYDEESYKGLPRMALVGIEKWIAEATT